ncbi:hypothetical protein HFP89_07460 [Wenzhouxiangella sp. XN79A]|uniref:DUF4785 domain-containing protein n=1 Tax=Wenzhouxiangella sp. XN79A TaxID=2724193 RepID=UPI00144A8C43|nr:DUF4785 domain-containing protein [Wenzhouxiangella sp. XN79A]NKI34999.1 hypothetical protein [Wenzhouxiangella sp. XN79A]
MKTRILTIAAVLAAGPLAVQTLNAQDVEPGLGIADFGTAYVLDATWLDAGPGDFGAAKLTADPAAVPASRHQESAPVQFAWPLTEAPAASLDIPRVDSRQYWVDATGAELAKGIELPLTAPGAVIRVSPLEPDAKVRIDPANIALALDGAALGASAIARLADGVSLKAAGLDVPESSLAFELGPDVRAGQLKLGVTELPPERHMVVHVFEPESAWVGQLTLPQHTLFTGEAISLGVGVGNGKSQLPLGTVRALITDPSAGEQFDLSLDPATGVLRGTLPKAVRVTGQDGLFEAHAWVETSTPEGLTVRRDLKIPFAVTPPLARFDGTARARLDKGLAIDIGVDTAVAGRFQVNAQVFGTAPDGELRPLAMTQGAATLPVGGGMLQLTVGADLVAGSGLGAPFEVRGLELFDQGRMFQQQRQQQALRLVR